MAREQEILCEEVAQFVNVLEGRTDLGVADAKRWTLKEWMTTIFPVRPQATSKITMLREATLDATGLAQHEPGAWGK